MIEVIGKTRFGNQIKIEWNISDSKMEILSISEFANPREIFDRSCALAALWIAVKHAKYRRAAERLLAVGNAFRHSDSQLNEVLKEALSLELGIATSIDRVKYGRSLLGVEYR